MGRVATGKSTLSNHVSEKLSIARYSSDWIRKKNMVGLTLEKRHTLSLRPEELYYWNRCRRKTYSKILDEAEKTIKRGRKRNPGRYLQQSI
ncbi:MAG: hypothetical protein U5J95_03385 [Balneolaceae bacterium]|nr:hypothetical protein [Balneolaceae bacterium]